MPVRRYRASDRDAVLALAPRLTVGVAPWRDQHAVAKAVTGWVRDSLDRADTDDTAVFVAADASGRLVGAVSVTERDHFAGDTDGYIGELVVDSDATRRGTGRALVAAAEDWARQRGLNRITLDTGAANLGARRFYAALGYDEEDVRLTRSLQGDPNDRLRA
ncbi:MAG: GNAT family N-acetyltransferase [Sporichthyaceae bacterium]|nr:GNAT family N-acetyltransferase [Sporichthyaceae bacterium]